jgi:hypothetical protein
MEDGGWGREQLPFHALHAPRLTLHENALHAPRIHALRTFRCAILGDPSFQGHAHAFLVPDEGFSAVVRLHDRLHSGPLARELRLDLPFIPHLAVANTPTPEACKEIVDALNARPFEIRGSVESLDVIGFDGTSVWTIEQVGF